MLDENHGYLTIVTKKKSQTAADMERVNVVKRYFRFPKFIPLGSMGLVYLLNSYLELE